MEATDIIFSGNVTPITNGHRALELSNKSKNHLYADSEFRNKSFKISPEFIFESIAPAIINGMEQNIAHRFTSAALRSNNNLTTYGSSKARSNEITTELLFDSKSIKIIDKNMERKVVHEQIKKLNLSRQPLTIGIALFSRKPVSPIKNRGYLPDLGDIHSIIRCSELAQLLSRAQNDEIHLNIFSDGFKYQRACGTPGYIISDYQTGLRFWSSKFGLDKYIKIINYEDIVNESIGNEQVCLREETYLNTYKNFIQKTRPLFNPNFLLKSFHDIERKLTHGLELRYIFFSIASSVFYTSGNLGNLIISRSDLAQNIMATFLAELYEAAQGRATHYLSDRGLATSLILEAWDASLKYVAISLTDRKLKIWGKIQPGGIKLTIHGKPGEIQFRPTNSKFPTMTSQHSVGGLHPTRDGIKITCKYRIEREASDEIPIILGNSTNNQVVTSYIPPIIRKMIGSEQPFCYIPSDVKNVYSALSGNYVDA